MKNTFGTSLTVTIFGESHGPAIGAVLDGLAPGIRIDEEYIDRKLAQRKPSGRISTARHEADRPEFLSGVFNGFTTGTPLCLVIKNENARSADYEKTARIARPSHADYTAFCKYGGYEDYRGGGHFSGRVTAALVAAGAIVMKALEDKNIYIGTHIKSCGQAEDRGFDGCSEKSCAEDIRALDNAGFPMLDAAAAKDAQKAIEEAARDGDSLGGVLETAITGLPAGVGEPWFDTFEGVMAHGIFSIPAVKGIEFGSGFGITKLRGSQANDPMRWAGKAAVTTSNNSGGINGGITNGMPVVFRTAIKPTPSIFKEQKTVDMTAGKDALLTIEGRHDPAIVHRARAVVDAVAALVTADMLTVRFGTDHLKGQEL